jgi:hypothetical protein
MPEMRRYRLMPVAFNAGHHALRPTDPGWEPQVQRLHEQNRQAMVDHLRHLHGEANLGVAVQNSIDLGSDPWSTIGWHIGLWLQVRHAFITGAYYPAAVAAGALGERILNHLLLDLAADCATDADRRELERDKSPTYGAALNILRRWKVLEADTVRHFTRLQRIRNRLVHFDPRLYDDLRGRSLEAVTTLRDAIDSQFGVLVQRRLIPNTPGVLYAKKSVETEPFFRRYMKPVALHVSPRHGIDLDPATGLWKVTAEDPVVSDVDTDEEFVRRIRYLS